MKKKNIAIIIGMWIAGVIAIAFIFGWAAATNSPSLTTLISVDIGIGVSTLLSIFSLAIWLADRIDRTGDKIGDRIDKIGAKIDKNTEKSSEISVVLARIEELLRGKR
jgi:hypothetical protein